ncbi:uncharacterized protein DUF2860 [Sinobacterium caligoides]|uniref:Uncharacterized protein DUF2860 n=1 Tax=Sinobacterium caligoides TaxID=933926 RepID=A0A3N2DHY6_9GAMM|nr:DUF2860 domain-containing protein [Sinobacterium caligoides]ROR99004.1 uncharacterized protein DUF2860 [Sinobacterium caligoides]
MKRYVSPLLLSLSVSPAFAQLADSAGFSGELSINAGWISRSSNFNTDGDKTIADNTQGPSSSSRALVMPLGSVAYTFGDGLNQQVFLGTSRDDIAVGTLALELGYRRQLADNTVVALSVLPTVLSGETWADPFLQGEKRHTTDETGMAYRVQLKDIAGSRFSVDAAYGVTEIDDERSGSAAGLSAADRALLARDSRSSYVKGSYNVPLSRTTFLQPSLRYVHTDADGEANSSDTVGAELSVIKLMGRHNLAVTAGYQTRSFDADQPIYGKARDDDAISLFAAYEYQQFMGWQDWSLVSLVGYEDSDADIDFYDSSGYLLSLGMNYKF